VLRPFLPRPREEVKVEALDGFGGSSVGIEIEAGRESGIGDGSISCREISVSRDIDAGFSRYWSMASQLSFLCDLENVYYSAKSRLGNSSRASSDHNFS